MPSKAETALSIFRNTAITNTAVSVKAATDLARVYDIHAFNGNSVDVYLHFYDLSAASVNVGTTVPTISFWIPANGSLDRNQKDPWPFSTAISISVSTTPNGGSAPSSAIFVQIGYL